MCRHSGVSAQCFIFCFCFFWNCPITWVSCQIFQLMLEMFLELSGPNLHKCKFQPYIKLGSVIVLALFLNWGKHCFRRFNYKCNNIRCHIQLVKDSILQQNSIPWDNLFTKDSLWKTGLRSMVLYIKKPGILTHATVG